VGEAVNGLKHALLFLVSLMANLLTAFSGRAGLIQLPVLNCLGPTFAVALATHKIATVALDIGATIRHLREALLERRQACAGCSEASSRRYPQPPHNSRSVQENSSLDRRVWIYPQTRYGIRPEWRLLKP